jgi:hypothetical protein
MGTSGIRCALPAPILLQVSCATSGGGAPPATPMTAANLGRIGFATGRGEPSYDFDLVPGDGPGQVQDLRYDFRMFGATGVVYERLGLAEPLHTLEERLPSCAEYRWTVRARFVLDGRQRATEWTGGYVDPMWLRGRPGKPAMAAVPQDATRFFAIVQTPGDDGAVCKCQ